MDVSELDDDMEISSETGHIPHVGDDLDVELASMRDPSLEPDPDFMVEDAAQDTHIGDGDLLTSTHDRNDDEMLDEDVQGPTHTEQHDTIDYDHDIQDEFDDTINTFTDQQLDFDGHQGQAAPQEDAPAIHVETSGDADDFAEQVEGLPQNEIVGEEPDEFDHSAPNTHPGAEGSSADINSSNPRSPQLKVQDEDDFAGENAISEAVQERYEEAAPRSTDETQIPKEQSQSATPHTSSNVQFPDDTSHTSTEDHNGEIPSSAEGVEGDGGAQLHPVKVLHEGSEVYLFPPNEEDSSETFFLHDDTLSNQTLSVLLKACREVLGESINEEEELEIEFHDLGLHTSEDSAHAAHITMSQIVDVYLRLKLNDGDTKPQPLYVSLRTRPHFSSRFFSVAKAAEEGKGTSHLDLWQETFSLDPQDPLPHPIEDVSTQEHSGLADQSEYTGHRVDGKAHTDASTHVAITDPDQERIFNEDVDQIAGSKDFENYQDYGESNGGPSAVEASESVESESKSQQIGDHQTHGEVEDSLKTDGDVHNDVSVGTSTLQGDDYGNTNDYVPENEENLPPDGDFFDDAVGSYDDVRDGSYGIGLGQYGDQAQEDDGENEGHGPVIEAQDPVVEHPTVEANQNLSRQEYGDDSFAFINDEDFEQPDESTGLDEYQFQDSYLHGDDQGNSVLTDLTYEAETTASGNTTQNATQLESLATPASKSTQPHNWATPPASVPEHGGAFQHAQTSAGDTVLAMKPSGNPTVGTKVNGSNTHTPPEQVFDDSDEINYDDDDDTGLSVPTQTTPKTKTRQGLTSPKSVKRNRPDEEEEDLIEYATPDPKKRRS